MFTTEERNLLIAKLLTVLNENKAGQQAVRAELAAKLADATQDYLMQLVISKTKPKNTTGVHQLDRDDK